jgi:hypothetical protein
MLKVIEFIKGKCKFRMDTKNVEIIRWKDKWRKAKGRWQTNIDIFEDLEMEDLLAYLIIKDKSKERTNEDEFN